ncbi:hypothetical protein Q6247_26675, partial [Klebsiella pneumoniae]
SLPKMIHNPFCQAAADVQGVEKETPLMIAAADGLTDNLECLVQARADPNPLDCVSSICCCHVYQTASVF